MVQSDHCDVRHLRGITHVLDVGSGVAASSLLSTQILPKQFIYFNYQLLFRFLL
jgi:hypothetical protein